jgi:hypothetical protein
MENDVTYKKINIESELYDELRQYCDDNGIRFVDFVENALEIALYESQVPTVEIKNDSKIYKKKSSKKNKTDKYSPTKLYTDYKANYRNHILFIQCGSFFEVYDDDALTCSELFGWKIFNRGEFRVAGTGISNKSYFIDKLRKINKEYVIIEQEIDEKDLEHPIKRIITEIYPD